MTEKEKEIMTGEETKRDWIVTGRGDQKKLNSDRHRWSKEIEESQYNTIHLLV